MNDDGIAGYLAALAAELPPDLPGRERILAEVGDHLATGAARLTAEGRSAGEAEADATARFGDPRQLAAVFCAIAAEAAEPPLGRAGTALAALAGSVGLIGALGLALLGGWSILDPDPIAARGARAVGLTAAAGLSGGIAAALLLRPRLAAARVRLVAAMASLTLVALGIAAVIGTVELGRSSGDYEWYGVGIGLALAVQGLAAAWLLGPRSPRLISG